MATRVVAERDGWESEPFGGGYGGLRDLVEEGFSGVVQSGDAKLCLANGTAVGVVDGSLEDFEDAAGTAYEAPSSAVPALAYMQEHGDEVRARYYTEDTPVSEVHRTLSEGEFTGYVELSENVLSGDYYVVYHAGRSTTVAWVGSTGRLVSGDDAFERADGEVGIYEVHPVEVDPVEIPGPGGAVTDGTATDPGGRTGERTDADATQTGAARSGTDGSGAVRAGGSTRGAEDTATAAAGGDRPGRPGTAVADRVPAEVPTAPARSLTYDDLAVGDLVGSGGNADVHEAVGPDGERFAVKLPRVAGTLHVEEVERILGEARTWGKLDGHDHVVSVVDWGETPRPWIATEYMDGGDLAGRVDDMSFPEAAWVATRTARAIEHAHRQGVAHLDLKPENVLFRSTPGDRFDVPKVADWGLSKLLLDHSGTVDGLSTGYAAPEQFDSDVYGEPNDRTDVYQLGVVAYEMFTGEPPFDGSTASVLNSVLNGDPDPPTQRDPSLPDAVDDVVLKALRTEKDDRYDHVVLFRQALEDLSPVE